MEFTETKLKGGFLVRLRSIEDHRGYFARAFCRDEFLAHGLNGNMIQLNVGFSHAKGTLRGLHYQEAPHQEAKIVRCSRGAIYDVMVDVRPESPTRGQWVAAELTPDNRSMLYVPEGFAHGYQTLVDDTEITYLASRSYVAAAATGVRFNDPAFAIEWPLPVAVVSDADRNWPDFEHRDVDVVS
jgi:dTDP-4-dehydrorhamnose 3,5-epimerase